VITHVLHIPNTYKIEEEIEGPSNFVLCNWYWYKNFGRMVNKLGHVHDKPCLGYLRYCQHFARTNLFAPCCHAAKLQNGHPSCPGLSIARPIHCSGHSRRPENSCGSMTKWRVGFVRLKSAATEQKVAAPTHLHTYPQQIAPVTQPPSLFFLM